MIKAIIFDCFGVLAESSYEPFKRKYLLDDIDNLNKFVQLDQLSSAGKMGFELLYKEFADLVGISYDDVVIEMKITPKNIELLEYIKISLKSNYKIGFLSNVAGDRLDEIFGKDDVALFDDVILSFQVNLAKPDTRIFELAANRLNILPEECVFVDDSEIYLEGAKKVGMVTVLYTDLKNFKIELEQILG